MRQQHKPSKAEPARPRSARRGSRRRSRSGSPYASPQRETSLPTTRTAYAETRQWLLDRHGPVCAYCERRVDPSAITLDHVTPRRGQTAYDRRDNLVLACTACNGRKADQPILAFLLANRQRAVSLLRYGGHLSPMLVELARELAGSVYTITPSVPIPAIAAPLRLPDPDSPYRD